MAATTHDLLVQLLDLILQERACVINLDNEGLMAATRAKEDVIISLHGASKLNDEEKKLASRIREENRHNAFLLKSALDWIRDNMRFFGQKVTPMSYGCHANTISTHPTGRLLSGQI